MDGNADIREQVLLMRAAIGRKVMEIDEFEEKATNLMGDEAEKCLDMMEFLKKDILGYKSIIDDLKDGSNDLTGDLWDIASLPEQSLRLYTDFYLPGLSEEDRAEDTKAMDIKVKYAQDLARAYVMHIGRMALTDPNVIDKILADENLVYSIGSAVLDIPELLDAIVKQQ
ncbi:MAG: hypothetical protein FWH45_02315 [Methanomassiliicoccaceae archaeon]|nr:hypothetical protein [Methanomassiliicoccaceae archaeon]MCL2145995.1 hypothetical protein [Methanomassiliicoccaceae archaeon]